MDKRSHEPTSPISSPKRRTVLKEKSTNSFEVSGKDLLEAGTMESLCEDDAFNKPAIHKEEIDIPEKELDDKPAVHKKQMDIPDECKEKPHEHECSKISNFDILSTSTSHTHEVEAPQDLEDMSPSELVNVSEAEFQALVDKFIYLTRNEDRSKTLLQITVICKSQRFIECPLYQKLTTRLLKKIKVYKSKKDLMLCQAMFVVTLSAEEQLDHNKEKFDLLKGFLFSYFTDINIFSQEYFNMEIDATTTDLPENVKPLIDFILSRKAQPSVACSDKKTTFSLFCMAAMEVMIILNKNPVDDITFHFEFCKSLIKKIEFFQGFATVQSFDLKDPTKTQINPEIMDWLFNIDMYLDLLKIALFNEPLKRTVIRFSNLLLLKNLQWVLAYCVEHAFVIRSEDFAVKLKTIIMSIVELLGSFTSIAYDDDLTNFGTLFMEKLLTCITQCQFTNFQENAAFKIYILEVCLLMMQNNWISKERFRSVLLMQSVAEPGLLTVSKLIKVLEFSLREIKNLEAVKISIPLSEEGPSFLQQQAPFADVEKFGEMHMDHSFTVAYISVLLAMFCKGKMGHQRLLQNSISTTEAQACVNIMQKIKEFIVMVENTPRCVDVNLLDRSMTIILSIFALMPPLNK